MSDPSGLARLGALTCIFSTANGLRMMYWGQTLQVLALIWQDAAAAVHVESVETIGKGDRLQMIR